MSCYGLGQHPPMPPLPQATHQNLCGMGSRVGEEQCLGARWAGETRFTGWGCRVGLELEARAPHTGAGAIQLKFPPSKERCSRNKRRNHRWRQGEWSSTQVAAAAPEIVVHTGQAQAVGMCWSMAQASPARLGSIWSAVWAAMGRIKSMGKLPQWAILDQLVGWIQLMSCVLPTLDLNHSKCRTVTLTPFPTQFHQTPLWIQHP